MLPDPSDPAAAAPAHAAAQLRERGFAVVDAPVFPAEGLLAARARVDTLQGSFPRLRREGRAIDLGDVALHDGAPQLPELRDVSRWDPVLSRSPVLAAATALACRLLGGRAGVRFDHVIGKPPGGGRETSWHQDMAFQPPSKWATPAVHLWVPLQAVGAEDGCMAYLPEAPSVLTHRRPAGRHSLVAALAPGEADQEVRGPVGLGGFCAHLPATPHRALPNHGPDWRYAWVFQFHRTDLRHRLRRRRDARRLDGGERWWVVESAES